MPRSPAPLRAARHAGAMLLALFAHAAAAVDIGQVKTASGDVTIERAGTSLPAKAGVRLEASDIVQQTLGEAHAARASRNGKQLCRIHRSLRISRIWSADSSS